MSFTPQSSARSPVQARVTRKRRTVWAVGSKCWLFFDNRLNLGTVDVIDPHGWLTVKVGNVTTKVKPAWIGTEDVVTVESGDNSQATPTQADAAAHERQPLRPALPINVADADTDEAEARTKRPRLELDLGLEDFE